MAGVPSSVIRFICHLPSAWVGFNGLSTYNAAKGMDIFNVLPNGNIFIHGWKIVGYAGCVTFAWNFVMFLGSIPCAGLLLGTVGIIDLVLSSVLILGVSAQSTFLPRTYASCDDAVNWRNATDGRNFFLAANQTHSFSESSPHDICYDMVQNWAFTIALIIIYLICSGINMLIGFGSAGCYCSRREHLPYYDRTPGKLIMWIPSKIGFVIRLPLSVFRFARRSLVKYFDRGGQSESIRLRRLPAINREDSGKVRSLAAALINKPGVLHELPCLPHDELGLIASHLHYADLINLSHASKRLRTIFLGAAEELRQYACEGASKAPCSVCTMPICSSCSASCTIWESRVSRHLTRCKPCCSRCFYKDFCVRKPGYSKCRCKGTKGDTNAETYSNLTHMVVCRFCTARTPSETQAILEAWDTREVQRLAQHPLTCTQCKVLLPSKGPRWWICSYCNAECRDHTHPTWAPKM